MFYLSILFVIAAVVCISSCEKDEDFEEEIQNELIFPKINGRFVSGKDVMQTPIIGDKIKSLSSSVINKSNNASSIQIDTSRVRFIQSDQYDSYTFQIVQDSIEGQSLLKNYMITILNDTTSVQHLISYNILNNGHYDMDNVEVMIVEGDSLIPSFLKCGMTRSLVPYTDCYSWNCDGNRHHSDSNDPECTARNKAGSNCVTSWTFLRGSSHCGGGGGGGSAPSSGGGGFYVPVDPVDNDDDDDDDDCELECDENEILDLDKCECVPENCEYKTGYLHENAFANNTAEEGDNTTSSQDNFRDEEGNIIEETNCDSGKIDSGSEVEITGPVEERNYTRTDGTTATSNYYPIKYLDCPKGNRPGNPDYDSTKPCSDCTHGDPVPDPEIQEQTTACGTKGGMFGFTRGAGGTAPCNYIEHKGMDIKNDYGDSVYAMFDGVATLHYESGGAGYYIIITSSVGDDVIKSYYFHLQQSNRTSGTVSAGDVIGNQGNSGNLQAGIDEGSTESHVHIKIRENGTVVDPIDFFKTTFNETTGAVTSSGCN